MFDTVGFIITRLCLLTRMLFLLLLAILLAQAQIHSLMRLMEANDNN